MTYLIDKLKHYFSNNTKEQILTDWNKSKDSDSIGPTVTEFLKANTMQKENILSIFRKVFNEAPSATITRTMLLDANGINGRYYHSIDTVRRQLSVTGFLSEGDGNGTYIILKQLPSDLTTSSLRKMYNQVKFMTKLQKY